GRIRSHEARRSDRGTARALSARLLSVFGILWRGFGGSPVFVLAVGAATVAAFSPPRPVPRPAQPSLRRPCGVRRWPFWRGALRTAYARPALVPSLADHSARCQLIAGSAPCRYIRASRLAYQAFHDAMHVLGGIRLGQSWDAAQMLGQSS